MGVRGLTTYIERNKHKYLQKHNLRDCQLVIDGNSLCAQLYKYNSKCNDVFGGDYDKFAKCIETFFSMLKQCNVTPVVIFDGGYEEKKIRTVNCRLQSKLKMIRNINPVCSDGVTIFPLFLREAFKDTLLRLKISLVRCDYEADLEIACVARQLECPVLSYDSDFYIFDCLYIPFTTMDFHVTRITDGQGSKYCINCNIYNIEVFLKQHRIQKPLLPLMATLLGNDYVKKNVFTKFYNQLKLPKKNGTRTPQYRTIIALINWLRNETYDTAVKKILSRVKRQERYKLGKILLKISQGYFATNSETLEYLGLSASKETSCIIPDINTDEIESDNENNEGDASDIDTLDTNSNSENESLEDLSEITEDKTIQVLNSEWFKKNVRNGNFPTLFIDILTLNMGFYIPQIEDTLNIQSFYIFLPILQGISKVLLKNTRKSFYYLARNEHSHVKKYSFKVMGMELPSINNLEKIDKSKSRKHLMKILRLSESYLIEIKKFPFEWQLYLLSLIYWVKKAKNPKVTYNHVSCIILCLLYLNVIDKIEPIRKKEVFRKKYETKLKAILDNKKENSEKFKNDDENQINVNEECDFSSLLKNVSNEDDIFFFIDSFVFNFETNEKLKTNRNLFSIQIVDAFAQFQSCLLHIKYLNALLNFPLWSFDICQFYNGTFIYNLYTNFEKRANIFNYIELLLKNSPLLLSIYNGIFNILNPILELSAIVVVNKKSRKRKRKKKETIETQDSDNCEENATEMDVDNFIDENNIFSILSIVE